MHRVVATDDDRAGPTKTVARVHVQARVEISE